MCLWPGLVNAEGQRLFNLPQAHGRINPVTYVLEGMRSLVLEGSDWQSLALGSAAILGLGVFTFALTLSALRAHA